MLKDLRCPGCTLGILMNVLLTRAVARFVGSDIAYTAELPARQLQNAGQNPWRLFT